MEKCSLCESRLREGKDTLCRASCTTRAIKTGTREEMMAHARRKVDNLRNQGYPQANIYGAQELGGLKVLSILRYEPGKYNLPKAPQIPLTLKVWNRLPVGPALLIAGGLVVAVTYFHNRKVKNRIKQAESTDRDGESSDHISKGG